MGPGDRVGGRPDSASTHDSMSDACAGGWQPGPGAMSRTVGDRRRRTNGERGATVSGPGGRPRALVLIAGAGLAAAVLAVACGGSGSSPTPTAALRPGSQFSISEWTQGEDAYYHFRFRYPPDWKMQQPDESGPHNLVIFHPGQGGNAVSFILVSVAPQQVPTAAGCPDASHETLAGYPVDICRYQRDIPTSFPLAPNEFGVRSFAWHLPDGIVYLTADISTAADKLEGPVAEAVMRTFERY